MSEETQSPEIKIGMKCTIWYSSCLMHLEAELKQITENGQFIVWIPSRNKVMTVNEITPTP